MNPPSTGEQVTRREHEELKADVDAGFREVKSLVGAISEKVDLGFASINKEKQVNWGFVLSCIGLVGAAIGFGIKNFTETAAHGATLMLHGLEIDGFRERMRGTEQALDSLRVESESQHRWIADVLNLQYQHLEQVMRMQHPEISSSDYWPLSQIGQATPSGRD